MDKNRLDQLERELDEALDSIWKLKRVVVLLATELMDKMEPERRAKLIRTLSGLSEDYG